MELLLKLVVVLHFFLGSQCAMAGHRQLIVFGILDLAEVLGSAGLQQDPGVVGIQGAGPAQDGQVAFPFANHGNQRRPIHVLNLNLDANIL